MNTKTKDKSVSQPPTGEPQTGEKTPATPKFNKDELLTIFDQMIFEGEYSEVISLRDGKLKVGFRSRSAEDTTAITRDIDSKNFTLITTLQEFRALQNLAYSLVSYAGNDWSKLEPSARLAKINKLPAPLVGLLSAELAKFDEKMFAACQEGEANF